MQVCTVVDKSLYGQVVGIYFHFEQFLKLVKPSLNTMEVSNLRWDLDKHTLRTQPIMILITDKLPDIK